MWALRDLRKADFSEPELLSVYKSSIRPVIEFSSPVYHPILTKEQSEYLKKQQHNALKNIYGYVYSGKKLLELSGVDTLEERRKRAAERFARKTSESPRFVGWFPKRKQKKKPSQSGLLC